MAFWHVDYCLDDKVPQHRSSFASPTPPDEYLGKSPWPKSSITTHSLSTARQGFFLDVDVAIQHMASCHSPVSDKFRGLRSGSCFKSILLIYEANNGMFATVRDIRNPLATSVPESLQNPRSGQHRNNVPHTTPFYEVMSNLCLLSVHEKAENRDKQSKPGNTGTGSNCRVWQSALPSGGIKAPRGGQEQTGR